MNKSVLVVNTPETCVDCIFCQEYRTKSREYAYCYVTNGNSENDMKLINYIYGYRQFKSDWCPLKELPEEDNEDYFPDEYESGYASGWNACLREITGQVKENY